MHANARRFQLSPLPLIGTIIALASVYAFLQDLINPNWTAWVLSPLAILAFRGVVANAPDGSLVRPAMYQAALILVPFMGVYGLVDALSSKDWPAWVIAPSVVALLWVGIAVVSAADAD